MRLKILLSFISGLNAMEIISVNIGNSTVRGLVEGRNGQREYYSFKGIQYAIAQRWKEPEMSELLSDSVYNATQFGSNCPQWKSDKGSEGVQVIGEENCLFLNIYTKILPDATGSRRGILNPVMVFIHGGGFQMGSGDSAGPRRFMKAEEKIVLVTVNSRLGILGFLSSGDNDLPGNWGLLDQIIALDWIIKYVEYFGGNPNQITIFGHSSGAAAVHLLTLSPLAQGKFTRAILHSGNGLCDANIEDNPADYATQVSSTLSCPISPKLDIACLRKHSVHSIIKVQKELLNVWLFPKRAVPVVDENFRPNGKAVLPATPAELIKAGKIAAIPLLFGVTKDEGLWGYAKIHTIYGNDKFRNASLFRSKIIPEITRAFLRLKSDEDVSLLLDLIFRNYFTHMNFTDEISFHETLSDMSDFVGDIIYYSCYRHFLEIYAPLTNVPVYSYVFSHKMKSSPSVMTDVISDLRQQHVDHWLFDFGVPHVQDQMYLFEPYQGSYPSFSSIDENVATFYTKNVIAFAKNGTPTFGYEASNIAWQPIQPGNLNFFNITSTPTLPGIDFKKKEAYFWLKIVPFLLGDISRNFTQLEQDLISTKDKLENFQILFWSAIALAILLLLATIGLVVLLWRLKYFPCHLVVPNGNNTTTSSTNNITTITIL